MYRWELIRWGTRKTYLGSYDAQIGLKALGLSGNADWDLSGGQLRLIQIALRWFALLRVGSHCFALARVWEAARQACWCYAWPGLEGRGPSTQRCRLIVWRQLET